MGMPLFVTHKSKIAAVAYGIVQRHQSKIEVQSKEGEGTTFSIYLPLYHEEKD